MSNFARKLERNLLKNQQGNNRIKEEWEKFQIYKIGLGQYEINKKKRKKKK